MKHSKSQKSIFGIVFLAASIFAMATHQTFGFTVKPGDIFVGNDNGSTVVKIDPINGEQTLIATFTTVTTNGLEYGGVHDLAFSPSGDLIVLQHSRTISRVNLLTGATTNITSEGLLGRNNLDTFTAGLTVAPNGDIYVSVYTPPYTGVVKVDPNTGSQISAASGGYISGPIGLGFSPSGELLVGDIASRRLIGVNTTTHTQRLIAQNLASGSPWGMTVDSTGNVFLGKDSTADGNHSIQKVTPAGSISIVASGGFLDIPTDVALEPGGTFLSFQTKSNAIVRINPTNNIQTLVSQGGLIGGALSLIVADFSVTPSNAPAQLNLQMHPGISIQGTVGGKYEIQYTTSLPTTNWISLTNIYLPTSPYLYFDGMPANQQKRFYRVVTP